MPGQAAAGNESAQVAKNPRLDTAEINDQTTNKVNATDAQAYVNQMNTWLASYGISPNDPNALSDYTGYEAELLNNKESGDLFNQIISAVSIGAVTAGVGSALGAAIGGGLGATAGTVSTASIAGDALGYGAASAGIDSIMAYGSGQDIGSAALHGAETGAIGGAVAGGLVPAAGQGISNVTGLGTTASDALAGAGIGATKGAITGGNIAEDAVIGGVGGAIKGSGLTKSISDTTGSSLVGGVATSELANIAGSTLTSSTGKSATSTSQLSGDSGTSSSSNQFEASTELSPGVSPVSTPNPTQAGVTTPSLGITSTPASTAPSSFGSDVLGGLTSTLGGGSLGTDLGTLLPYAGVAAIGEAQAAAGQASDAKSSAQQQALAAPAIAESAQLAGQYNTGTLNSTDAAVVNTGIAQGQSTIASAGGLSAIAQTAFANYNSGTLNAGDQAALDAQTAAQKQQVAQQLASAGITDSTILAAQNQQIDNNALISKQNTLNGYFNTGNSAYNSWLTATTEGQQTITQAQTYASTSLQTYLSNSMAEANIGIGEVNTAIQTQMTTDANYAAQVSTLLGTLATAYAKQIAGQKSSGGSTGTNSVLGGAGKPSVSASGGGGGGIGLPGDTVAQTGQAGTEDSSNILGQNLDNQTDIQSGYLGSLTDLNNELQNEVGDGSDIDFGDDGG